MITEEIKEKLKSLQDIRYRNFQAGLIPTVDNDKVIGVRTPELRKLAKEMSKRDDADDFLRRLEAASTEEEPDSAEDDAADCHNKRSDAENVD